MNYLQAQSLAIPVATSVPRNPISLAIAMTVIAASYADRFRRSRSKNGDRTDGLQAGLGELSHTHRVGVCTYVVGVDASGKSAWRTAKLILAMIN
jgi:hypothetical protein